MAEVKLRFTADTASATKGIRDLKGSLDGLKSAGASFGSALKKSIVAIGAGLTAVGAAAAKGTKDVIDFASEIKDVADSTGASIENLTILREQFRQAGVDSGKLQSAMSILNSKLENPSEATLDWLKELGLDSEKLLGMDPAARFEAVGNAIGQVGDSAKSLAASKDLFGKVGADLNRMFQDPESRANAIKMLGELPSTLTRVAGTLEAAGDVFDGIGVKWNQFFLGFAGQLLGPIEEAANFIENLDLTQMSVKPANFVNNVIEKFKTGELTTILMNAFVGAVASAAVEIGIILTFVIGKAFDMGWKKFIDSSADLKLLSATANAVGLDPESKYRFTNTSEQAAKVNSFGDLMRLDMLATTANENYSAGGESATYDELRDLVKNEWLPELTKWSDDAIQPLVKLTEGGTKMVRAEQYSPYQMKKLQDEMAAVRKANAPKVPDISAQLAEDDFVNQWVDDFFTSEEEAAKKKKEKEKKVEGAYQDVGPVVSSLGRIGGARGETNNVINFQNKSLQYQKEIANNTAKMTGGALIGS